MMQMMINGTERQVQAATVAALLEELGLDPTRVAIELNRTVVSKALFAETLLTPGDAIEIVHFVGGG